MALLATFGVSLLSLVGLVFFFRKGLTRRLEVRLLGFAAGVLLATSFLELLPEALETGSADSGIFLTALLAMVGFYYVERVIHGVHDHHQQESHTQHRLSSRYLILFGDGVHNLIDGVVIASAFLVSPEVGVAATAAIAAHELPHELGDYGVLVHSGLSRSRALFYNFLSALPAVFGAVLVFLIQPTVEANLGFFLAAAAGMFIYIAAANLIPELHHQRVKGRFIYGLPFALGIVTIWAVILLVPHGHVEGVEEGSGADVPALDSDGHGHEDSHDGDHGHDDDHADEDHHD